MSDSLSAWFLQTVPPREGPALQRSANATPGPPGITSRKGVEGLPTWSSSARVLLCLLLLSREVPDQKAGPGQALCPRLAPLGEELVATSPRVQDGCDCLPGVTRG